VNFSVSLVILACWAIVGSAVMGQAQNIECLRDVPFTATRIYASPGVTTTGKIARASNGSWFIEQFNAKGIPQYITIKDVPLQRMITLFVRPKQYAISVMNPINFKTYSAQEWLDVLHGSHNKSPGPSELGAKVEAGTTLFGYSLTFNNQITESWEAADLGTTYSYRTTSLQGEPQMNFTLTNIRREEPDPTLFEIPDGYVTAKIINSR
jgi:hypothetical protein